MKKLLNLPILLSIVMISGCATTQNTNEVVNKSSSDMVSKKTVDQSVLETVEEINGQLVLLEKLNRGIAVPVPPEVVHNQNLQEEYVVKPIPQKMPAPEAVVEVKLITDSSGFAIPSEFNKKANIQWNNKSLNLIVRGIARAVNYDFVVVPSKKMEDQNINFNVSDETLIVVLKNVATVVDSFADIEVLHKDKVIKVVYK